MFSAISGSSPGFSGTILELFGALPRKSKYSAPLGPPPPPRPALRALLLLGSARFSSLNCALQGNPSRCYSTATFFLPLPRFLLLALLFHLSRVTVGIAISFQKLALGPVSFQGEEIRRPPPKMSRAPYLF